MWELGIGPIVVIILFIAAVGVLIYNLAGLATGTYDWIFAIDAP